MPSNPGFISGQPTRTIGRARRSLRGAVTILGRRVAYESGLERDFLHLLSLDTTVEEIIGQPLAIECPDQAAGIVRTYTPDFLVRHAGPVPATYLIEVKYRTDLWQQFWREGLRARLLGARRLCREQGWEFRVRTEVEIRGPKVANMAFLRQYARLEPDPSVEEPLAATLATIGPSTPQALLAATFWHDDNRARAIPHLWRLLAVGRIECDLSLPLTMSSPITIIVGDGYQWTDPYSYRSGRGRSSGRPGAPGASRVT